MAGWLSAVKIQLWRRLYWAGTERSSRHIGSDTFIRNIDKLSTDRLSHFWSKRLSSTSSSCWHLLHRLAIEWLFSFLSTKVSNATTRLFLSPIFPRPSLLSAQTAFWLMQVPEGRIHALVRYGRLCFFSLQRPALFLVLVKVLLHTCMSASRFRFVFEPIKTTRRASMHWFDVACNMRGI
jgi:hypothetical protein